MPLPANFDVDAVDHEEALCRKAISQQTQNNEDSAMYSLVPPTFPSRIDIILRLLRR